MVFADTRTFGRLGFVAHFPVRQCNTGSPLIQSLAQEVRKSQHVVSKAWRGLGMQDIEEKVQHVLPARLDLLFIRRRDSRILDKAIQLMLEPKMN